MRLLTSLGLLLALSATALADDGIACHVTLTSSSQRLEHHTTSCHTTDDTKYDDKLEASYSVRAACKISMDSGGITIELDDSDAATGSMRTKQENQGVWGSSGSSNTTLDGKASGTIMLMKQPSGLLLPNGSLSFGAKTSSQQRIHSNCDPHAENHEINDTSTLDALITPFSEVYMHQKDPSATFTAPPVFKISRESFEEGFASHKPFSVTGSGTYDWHDDNTNADVHDQVTMKVEIGKSELKYDAVLVPIDKAGYPSWMPEGPTPGGSDDDGNSLGVRLEVRDHKTHKPASVKFHAVYKLETSNIPGWSMNTPQTANDKADLFFSTTMNLGHSVTSDREMNGDATGIDTVTVSARDFGAHGSLRADVSFDDGSTSVRTTIEGAPDAAFQIPLDANHNEIADAWEGKLKLGAESADDEDLPKRRATLGDGYTVFEEYRGFWLIDPADKDPKPRHIRLDPTRRDLLVFATGAGVPNIIKGAAMYGAAAEVHVLIVPSSEQLKKLDGDASTLVRWTDFNGEKGDKRFGNGQVAAVVSGDSPTSRTVALDGLGFRDTKVPQPEYMSMLESGGSFAPPGDSQIAKWLELLQNKGSPQLEAGLVHDHLDRATVIAYVQQNASALAAELQAFRAMHELGHQTGSNEHSILLILMDPSKDNDYLAEKYMTRGVKTCPQRYWHYDPDGVFRIRFLAGTWDLTKSPLGTPWHYCTESAPMMRLRQRAGQNYSAKPSPRD